MTLPENLALPITTPFLTGSLGLAAAAELVVIDLAQLSAGLDSGLLQPADFLAAPEQQQYLGYRHRKRQLEWLGGRLAAKQAVLQLTGTVRSGAELLTWQVCADEHGRPFFQGAAGEPPGLSISHSQGLAAALVVSAGECGLDLQKISSATGRVKEKFCSPAEYDIIGNLAPATYPDAGLTLLWSAKEALRKARGGHPLTGLLEMELVAVAANPETGWFFTMRAENLLSRIMVFFYRDFAVAITTTPLEPRT